MSTNANAKKALQLGMSQGKATNILRKQILFTLIALLELDTCFRCNKKITNVSELSIEHKEPWLDSEDPKAKFFDLQNIAFSHLNCNCRAVRHWNKKYNSPEEAKEAHLKSAREWKKNNRIYDPVERKARYQRLGT